MACNGAYSDANDFAQKFCFTFDEQDESEINRILAMAASNIHMALAAQGMCDCTVSDWGNAYLIDLNCVIAAAFFNCHCMRVSSEDRRTYADWATSQLEQLRTGKLDICDGATGPEFPVTTWAEQATTPWAAAQIILNDALRE